MRMEKGANGVPDTVKTIRGLKYKTIERQQPFPAFSIPIPNVKKRNIKEV
jgi:hypothetical protein